MSQGIITFEINDPISFNRQSSNLLTHMHKCVLAAGQLVCTAEARANILQGNGAHFCTGASFRTKSCFLAVAPDPGDKISLGTINLLEKHSSITRDI